MRTLNIVAGLCSILTTFMVGVPIVRNYLEKDKIKLEVNLVGVEKALGSTLYHYSVNLTNNYSYSGQYGLEMCSMDDTLTCNFTDLLRHIRSKEKSLKNRVLEYWKKKTCDDQGCFYLANLSSKETNNWELTLPEKLTKRLFFKVRKKWVMRHQLLRSQILNLRFSSLI
ncbi:MAG: hypothetical protein MK033_08355 [Candidatus Caenarcaniphilales bacterium]|nr:hypothetical protein [Candidatus Caenarcaniphilales bacterium]